MVFCQDIKDPLTFERCLTGRQYAVHQILVIQKQKQAIDAGQILIRGLWIRELSRVGHHLRIGRGSKENGEEKVKPLAALFQHVIHIGIGLIFMFIASDLVLYE